MNYELATGLSKKTNDVRLATFLTVIGDQGYEKYESFSFEEEADKNKIDKVLLKFDAECKILTNQLNERYKFLQRK